MISNKRLLVALILLVIAATLAVTAEVYAVPQNTTACAGYYQKAQAALEGSQQQATLANRATACYLKATR